MIRLLRTGSFIIANVMATAPASIGGTIYFQLAPATNRRMQHTVANNMVVPKSGSQKIKPNVTAMAAPGIAKPYLNSRIRTTWRSPQSASAINRVILANSEG